LGGTLVDLTVVEGDVVTSGQPIGRIEDEKLAFQLSALAAQRGAILAQLDNAQVELTRGESLLKQGVTTAQGLDALRTQVDVLKGQLAALDAQTDIITQQVKEGTVLAPADGRVLDVPVSKGGVVMPGEAVALIGGGGTYLRLSIPERHAPTLHAGDKIEISDGSATQTGTLSRIYPLIQNGRVIADVEVAGLADNFVDARVLVRLAVGQRDALMVAATALSSTGGLDFVSVQGASGPIQRSVVPGEHQLIDGVDMVEILSGLEAGDLILPGAAE
jgi:RND family efflux transporter MFP subunit